MLYQSHLKSRFSVDVTDIKNAKLQLIPMSHRVEIRVLRRVNFKTVCTKPKYFIPIVV